MRVLVSQEQIDVGQREKGICDCLPQNLVVFLEKQGLVAVPVPNTLSSARKAFETFPGGGIVLSGGADALAPTGGTRWKSGEAAGARQRTESELLALALERGWPILGICRGMQAVNMFFGGAPPQRLEEEESGRNLHIGQHAVTLARSVRGTYACGSQVEVNSFHRLGLRPEGLAREFEVLAACTSDGIVEAFVHTSLPILGLQWHPERNGISAGLDTTLVRRLFLAAGPEVES